MIASSDFTELVVNLFLGMQETYKEVAERAELDEETTLRFLQSHGMEPQSLEGKDGGKLSNRYREAIEALAFEWIKDAVDYDQRREILRDCLLPEWLEEQDVLKKVWAAFGMTPCACGSRDCDKLAGMIGLDPAAVKARKIFEEAGYHVPGDPTFWEAQALRAGEAGKAAFEAALAEGKSRTEANEIALAAAAACAAEDEVEF